MIRLRNSLGRGCFYFLLSWVFSGLLIAGIGASFASSAAAAEVEETARSAFGAFLQGRYEEAASGYRYLDTLGVGGAAPTVNMALLARDQGKPEEALPLWLKATLLAPQNAFLWNQRGWCYLSMGRRRDALDAFHKAVEVSSAPADTAEADFGIGMTQVLDSNLKSAVVSFQDAYVRSPYLLSVASSELGRMAVRFKEWTPAELYFKQSLDRDPLQPDVARELAYVYDKMNLPKAAWLAYKLSLDLDPYDPAALRGLGKNVRYIRERPESLLPVRRLAQPLLRKPVAPPNSPAVRVGLFSNGKGEPAHARHIYFMSGAEFRLSDVRLGEVNRGMPYEQWEIAFQPDADVIEIRDVHHQLQYTTKQSFRIEPKDRGATVLLKSVEVTDMKGVDLGDREVRGAVEVIPSPYGFHLVNELGVEEYLYSVVGSVMPPGTPIEALKAEAVVERTRLEAIRRRPAHDALLIDLCDSAYCRAYAGLSGEREEVTQAVLDTVGAMLYQEGSPIEAREQVNCAGSTEEGVQDRAAPSQTSAAAAAGKGGASLPAALGGYIPPGVPDAVPGASGPGVRSVWDLENLTHEYPARENYCEVSPLALASWARWMHVLDAKDLRAHLGDKDVGRIHEVRILRRSPTGRVAALEIEGPGGKMTFEGKAAIDGFLYPGGLRSNLFTLQPIYRGHVLEYLLVWGAGTGDGRGMCVAGALGQAHDGKDAHAILAHYFPNVEIRGLPAAVAPPTYRGRTKRRSAASTSSSGAKASWEKSRALKAQQIREKLRRKALRQSVKTVQTSTAAAAPVAEPENSQTQDDSPDNEQ